MHFLFLMLFILKNNQKNINFYTTTNIIVSSSRVRQVLTKYVKKKKADRFSRYNLVILL